MSGLVWFVFGARHAAHYHRSRRCAGANARPGLPVLRVSTNAGAIAGHEPCGRCVR